MATATAPSTATAIREARWPYLIGYLALVIVAEACISFPGDPSGLGPPLQPVGLGVHILLVFALTFLSVPLQSRNAALASLLVAASLASLVRVFSLAVPRFPFVAASPADPLNTIPWLALVSVPLLVSVVAVAYVQRLGPRELGLRFARRSDVLVQAGIAATGIPLGLIEFAILRPAAWIGGLVLGSVVAGTIVIFLATGLSEELIFRGILFRRAVEGLGERRGLLYVTAIFTSLHLYFLNPADLVFVFGVGLFYGLAVLRTGNLWGVIFSHSLGNVILYLVAPFLIAPG
jgi:membrane protease YdiL (CAAX protease family)